MNCKEIESQILDTNEKIFSLKEISTLETASSILDDIKSLSMSDAVFALDEMGAKLKRFSDSIDLGHPDLKRFYEGQFVNNENGSFNRHVKTVLGIAEFIKSNDMPSSYLLAAKSLLKGHPYYSKLINCIDDPVDNQLHMRFMFSPTTRNFVRFCKRFQSIYFSLNEEDFKAKWSKTSGNIFDYSFGNNVSQIDIDECNKRKAHLLSYGLKSMAELVNSSIEEIISRHKEDYYYGFNKVNLIDSSFTLAKMLGFEYFETRGNVNYFKFDSLFERFGNDIQSVESNSILSYNPSLYTYSDICEGFSNNYHNLINHLDCYPGIGNKALFDRYWVIIPSLHPNVSFTLKNDLSHLIPMTPKKGLSFGKQLNANECKRLFDIIMLKNKLIFGILLGERDGEHYFINVVI